MSEDAGSSQVSARAPQTNAAGSAVFAAICFMLFAGVFVEAGHYGPEAQLFPRLIALLAMASAAVSFVQSFQAAKRVRRRTAARVDCRDSLISYGGPPLYGVLIFVLGFWIASAVSLPGLLYILGARRAGVVLAITAGTLASIYVIFELGFEIRMPGSVLLEMYGF